MKDSTQEYKPVPVEYDHIEELDTHVVGVMQLEGTDEHGAFEFRVHGPKDDVLSYGEKAVIHQLELHVLGEEEDPSAERKASILERRRAYWDEWLEGRCKALHRLIGEADLGLLADVRELSVRLGLELFTGDKLPAPAAELELDWTPDLTRDRLCEIEPLDLDDDVEFHLLFRVHPPLSQGKRDIYAPTTISTAASAKLTKVDGNPDLYLTRGGKRMDQSTLPAGMGESVYSEGGSGKWRVHVYACTTAEYELSAGWIYKKTRIGLPP